MVNRSLKACNELSLSARIGSQIENWSLKARFWDLRANFSRSKGFLTGCLAFVCFPHLYTYFNMFYQKNRILWSQSIISCHSLLSDNSQIRFYIFTMCFDTYQVFFHEKLPKPRIWSHAKYGYLKNGCRQAGQIPPSSTFFSTNLKCHKTVVIFYLWVLWDQISFQLVFLKLPIGFPHKTQNFFFFAVKCKCRYLQQNISKQF